MTFLLLSLLCSVGIFLFFKYFHLKEISLLKAVAVNYLACTLTGLFYHGKELGNLNFSLMVWLPFAIIMGGMFFFTFSLMGRTTAKNGVAAASMATKLSLVFPTLLSLFILQTTSPNIFLVLALLLSVPSIVLASKKLNGEKTLGAGLLLPFAVFFFSGIIDGGLNLLNYSFSSNSSFIHFPGAVFFFAAITGFSFHFIKKGNWHEWEDKRIWFGGAGLGVLNYFSIEFLLRGLEFYGNDGALVFPFLNVGIIILSSVAGLMFFKEKLSGINLVGLGLSIVCLGLLVVSSFQ